MSHRLQLLIPEELDLRISKAARRSLVSKGEWVRRAIEQRLRHEHPSPGDPLARLSALDGPTGDIERMIAETEAGRA
jgi:hypothetical protein